MGQSPEDVNLAHLSEKVIFGNMDSETSDLQSEN